MFFRKSHKRRKNRKGEIAKVAISKRKEPIIERAKEQKRLTKILKFERIQNVDTERKRTKPIVANRSVYEISRVPRKRIIQQYKPQVIKKSEICKARKEKRELIFKITRGKGMSVKQANFNELSKVRCK